MSIGLRLKQLLDSKGLTPYMVADATGISQSTFSRILNKDSKPNASTLKVISDYFGVEPSWLLVGDNNESKKRVEKQPVFYMHENIMNVPLVNQYAYAGYMNGFNDPEFIEELPKIPFLVEKEHKGEYICFEVKGDSMDNGTHESSWRETFFFAEMLEKIFGTANYISINGILSLYIRTMVYVLKE